MLAVEVKLDNVAGILALMGVSAGGAGGVSDLAFFRAADDGSGLERFLGDGALAGVGAGDGALMGVRGAGVVLVVVTDVHLDESKSMATMTVKNWWRDETTY